MIAGVGTDVVEIMRIESLINKYKNKFVQRIFTENEINYCLSYADSPRHFAGRFAVKEAVMKLLGIGWSQGIEWQHIETIPGNKNAPIVKLHFNAMQKAKELGINKFHVSISHSEYIAIATVIGESYEKK